MKDRTRRWLPPRAMPALIAFAFAAAQGANGGTETGYSPRIPDIQHSLHLSDGMLGAVLWGWSVGMLLAAPFAGRLCDRLGTRLVFLLGALLYWLPFPLIGVAHNAAAYAVCLFVIGIGNGCFDVALNIMSARRDSERFARARASGQGQPRTHNVMWSAVFSLISVVTAVLGSIARQHQVPITVQLTVIAAVALGLTVPFVAVMPNVRNPWDAPDIPLSRDARKQLGWLVLVSVAAGFPIGAVYAWSTEFVGDLGVRPIVAGLGLDGFALCQGFVQIAVFAVSHRIPRRVLVSGGGVVALVGAALTLSTSSVDSVVVGFALIGAGLAATIAFCANQAEEIATDTWKGRAVGRVTLAVYGGLACAQPVMGVLAQLVGLRFAWASVAVCGATLIVAARWAFRAPDVRVE
jgi:MFS family permease